MVTAEGLGGRPTEAAGADDDGGHTPHPSPDLSPATVRAYRSDLLHLSRWTAEHDLGTPATLTDHACASYFAGLLLMGATRNTIRRRASAIRFEAAKPDLVEDLRLGPSPPPGLAITQIEKRALRAIESRTSALIVAHDPIIRAGLMASLTESGLYCWATPPESLPRARVVAWNYVIAWLDHRSGIDRYSGIEAIRSLGIQTTTSVPVIGVVQSRPHPLLRLRMSEAGLRYVVSHSWLSEHVSALPRLLTLADIPIRYHIESPLALREKSGLALSGDIGAMLDAARAFPAATWESSAPRSSLALDRADVEALRRLSALVAGLPPADDRLYAPPTRAASSLPSWAAIQHTIRRCLGIPVHD